MESLSHVCLGVIGSLDAYLIIPSYKNVMYVDNKNDGVTLPHLHELWDLKHIKRGQM